MVSLSTWTDPRYMDMSWTDLKATWHPHGLGGLQGILNGNYLRPTIKPYSIESQHEKNPNMRRIP